MSRHPPPPPVALERCFAHGLDLSEFDKGNTLSSGGSSGRVTRTSSTTVVPHSQTLAATLRQQAEAREVQEHAENQLRKAIQAKVHRHHDVTVGKKSHSQKHDNPYSALVHMHAVEQSLDEPRHKLHKAGTTKKRNKAKHSIASNKPRGAPAKRLKRR